jgi:hypothetical protein
MPRGKKFTFLGSMNGFQAAPARVSSFIYFCQAANRGGGPWLGAELF